MTNRLAYARMHCTDNWIYIILGDEIVFTIKNKGRMCWIQRGKYSSQINVTQYTIQAMYGGLYGGMGS